MNKKILLIVTIATILIAGTVAYMTVSGNTETPNDNTQTSGSTEVQNDNSGRDEYQKCVDGGGEVNTELAPSYCVIDGKTYTDGNF